mmetsp:Transcript_27565/g.70237  ORF Transcript_27565/g.70237 Transcript_27565/m.70237 type:complete len:245 (-) Transcript_27565:240-974(-)
MLSMLHPMVPFSLDEMTAHVLSGALNIPTAHTLSLDGQRPSLTERDGNYEVRVCAPGVKMSDITVSITGEQLKVTGASATNDKKRTHIVDWIVNLPRDANTEVATACCHDGLVLIDIPQNPEVSHQVAIQTVPLEVADESVPTYKLCISAPGVAVANLEIVIDEKKGVAAIHGETSRTGAQINRVFRLPRDVDGAHSMASHIDGILTLSIPKRQQAEERKLELNAPEAPADSADDGECEDAVMV